MQRNINREVIGKEIRKEIGNSFIALSSTDEELYNYFSKQLNDCKSTYSTELKLNNNRELINLIK